MERKNEKVLQNAKLENVMRYLSEKLKGINGKAIEKTNDNGTILTYCIQNPQLSFPILNKIEVRYTTTVIPKGDMEKAYGYWRDLNAMRFEGMQLQENTVLIKAECEHPVFVSIFDRYWADLLTAFGADTPHPNDLADPAPLPAVKDEKPKTRKTISLPKSKAPLRKWALLWEFNDKHYELQKLSAKQFRLEFELYDKFDKPKWIPQDDETLQAILDYGRACKIPKHDSIE